MSGPFPELRVQAPDDPRDENDAYRVLAGWKVVANLNNWEDLPPERFAFLFAAAPELLAACEELITHCPECGGAGRTDVLEYDAAAGRMEFGGMTDPCRSCSAARAVVAKAKGDAA